LGGLIASLLPRHTCYVEVFAGGAGVYCAKERSPVEVLNDRNQALVTLFRVYQRHPEALLKELGLLIVSRRWYEDCWAQPGLTDVERAARFWYRIRHTFCNKPAEKSFGYGTVRGSRGGSPDPEIVRATVMEIHARLHGTIIEDLPWDDCIPRYDRAHTCFYCDPPYYEVGKMYGAGLDFSREDHGRLAGVLHGIRGSFVLSLNDRPGVRALYRWARMRRVKVRYSLGTNTAGRARRRQASGKLLITNRPWVDGKK
jgi:DNA adenine methylase